MFLCSQLIASHMLSACEQQQLEHNVVPAIMITSPYHMAISSPGTTSFYMTQLCNDKPFARVCSSVSAVPLGHASLQQPVQPEHMQGCSTRQVPQWQGIDSTAKRIIFITTANAKRCPVGRITASLFVIIRLIFIQTTRGSRPGHK